MNIRTILLAGGMLCSLVGVSQADGINSANGSDLPIGAGGTPYMWLGGGSNAPNTLPLGKINFGAHTSPKAWINSLDGSATFGNLNVTNLTDSGDAKITGTIEIGGAKATSSTITTANALAAALSTCGVGSTLMVGAGGTLTCGTPTATCTATSAAKDLGCPSGYTGSHTQQRDYTCSGSTGTWGGWYDTANTCTASTSCTPTSQTKSIACPSGYTGGHTQERDYTCSGSAGTWSAWYDTANTCTASVQQPPSCASITSVIICDLYQDIVGRRPDYAGNQFWTNAMNNSGLSQALSNEHAVLAYLRQGAALNPETVRYAVTGQPLAGGYVDPVSGWDVGNATISNSFSNADGLTSLYKNILWRDPDSNGYNWWLNKLNTDGTTLEDVKASFIKTCGVTEHC